MKKIIIIISICLIIACCSLAGYFYYSSKYSKSDEDINESDSENIKNDDDDTKNISNNNVSTGEDNLASNNVSNNNVVNNNINKSVEQEKHTETVVQEQKPEPKVEVKQQTEWEKLGISEYDYYNKPMWSWARVDYSINDYGSFEQTHQACIDAGNNMEDILSFSCTNINSYSGAYLGDMLRVKY